MALERLLEIIGEAARGLSPEFVAAHPEIPWAKMVGMRNRLIHGYYDVDMDFVWNTIRDDLAPVLEHLKSLHREQTEQKNL